MTIKSKIILLFAGLCVFSCSRPVDTASSVDPEGDEYEDTTEFLTPQIDPDPGAYTSGVKRTYVFKFMGNNGEVQELYKKDSDVILKPASTMKMFTGWWSFQKKTRTQAYLSTMLHKSNNAMATSIFKQMGGRTSITNYYKNIGLPVTSTNFVSVDGSGLSYSNKTNCDMEMGLMEYIYKQSSYSTFKKLLAQPGAVGTLAKRLGSLKGKVFAKTGTLKATISLSGFLEIPSRGVVLFCALSDYLNVSNASERARIDAMVTRVYKEQVAAAGPLTLAQR